MRNAWPMVRLGDILTERREEPDPEELAVGRIRIISRIGFRDGQIGFREGAGTRTPMILVFPGDLVVSGINATKGAIAVYGRENHARVAATIHFGAYEIRQGKADLSYLWWYLRSAAFRRILLESLPGGIKTELKSSRLLPIEIPLPSLPEQRRIVARIKSLVTKISEARLLRQQAVEEAEALLWGARTNAFPRADGNRLGTYVRFQTGYAFKSEWFTEGGVRLARNKNVGHGKLDWSEVVRIPESRRTEFERFELHEGDIVVSLDRPIISTGVKVAKVSGDDLPSLLLQRVARAQFAKNRLNPDYLFHWLCSPCFITAIDPGRSNGVPHISHKDVERIPFALPSLEEQRRIVAHLELLQVKVDALKRLQAETAAELDALLHAILDRAFKGEL